MKKPLTGVLSLLVVAAAGYFFFIRSTTHEGWVEYSNEEYGFSFRYPQELGSVETLYEGASTFGFSQNSNLSFGVYSDSAGERGVGILDFTGYEKEGERYYGTWAGKFTSGITPSNIISVDGKEVLIVNNNSFGESYYLSLVCPDGNMGALINLDNPIHGGLAFVNDCTWELVEGQRYERNSDPLPTEQFEAIISTLEIK